MVYKVYFEMKPKGSLKKKYDTLKMVSKKPYFTLSDALKEAKQIRKKKYKRYTIKTKIIPTFM